MKGSDRQVSWRRIRKLRHQAWWWQSSSLWYYFLSERPFFKQNHTVLMTSQYGRCSKEVEGYIRAVQAIKSAEFGLVNVCICLRRKPFAQPSQFLVAQRSMKPITERRCWNSWQSVSLRLFAKIHSALCRIVWRFNCNVYLAMWYYALTMMMLRHYSRHFFTILLGLHVHDLRELLFNSSDVR